MNRFGDNPLARGAARFPASVQRKLLFAFAVVVVLLVAIGAIGLGVLAQSNSRIDTLGQLPQRLVVYQQLANDSQQLTTQLANRFDTWFVCFSHDSVLCDPDERRSRIITLVEEDGEINSTIDLIEPLTDVSDLPFLPPAGEARILDAARSSYVTLSMDWSAVYDADISGGPYQDGNVEKSDNGLLYSDVSQLVVKTTAAQTTLIRQNNDSYQGSQHLFLAVAGSGAALALILGLVLSSAIVEPVRRMRTRLAAIASGDFSGHVEVPNRDELGGLAADLNRMNDELGRLYSELEAASKHKSEFLANMSHELRTPLNAVIGFSDVLRDQMFGALNEKQMEYVNDIHTSGRHLLTLINDILDMSKIEAGRMDLQVSSFSLPEVLRNSVSLLRERATRQGIALSLDIDPNIDVIEADERLVKQVLFNLLSNALNFTERGGHVDVAARERGDEVAISVRDDGVGIAPEDQARIFLEFEQAGRSTAQEGTGLGLALSRRFVELHGGRLTVDSAPGAGSTFTFTLPKVRTSAESVTSGAMERDHASVPLAESQR
jgi:signal transduction histidine kinase